MWKLLTHNLINEATLHLRTPLNLLAGVVIYFSLFSFLFGCVMGIFCLSWKIHVGSTDVAPAALQT